MDYFENLPKINVTYGDTTNLVRNLFFKIRVVSTINPEYLIVYKIKDGQTLEDISYEVYGDTSLWWIVALVNNIKDVFYDLPIDPEAIQKIANVKAKTVKGKITTGGTTSIIVESIAENYTDDYFNGSIFRHLTGTNATQNLTIIDYAGQNATFSFSSANMINASDTFIIEDAPLDLNLFSTYYDLLELYNEKRRNINVIRPDYIPQFLSDVTKEVANNT